MFKDCMTVQYKDFSGRATRAELFRFILVIASVEMVIMLLVVFLEWTALENIAYYVPFFVFLVPTYAVTVRRLHDSGLSAWWVLLDVPTEIFNLLLGLEEPGRILEPFVDIASFMSVVLFILCMRRSQIFTNKYGPLPDFTKYVKP